MDRYRVFDLSETDMNAYLCCLKTWDKCFYSDRKLNWYNKMKKRGLGVKIIKDKGNKVLGMVQYLPAEESFVEGKNIYLIQCIWVQGYERGPGNVQNKGLGKLLLEAVERDVKDKEVNGLAAWGMSFEEWMPVSWYVKQGFIEADRDEPRVLVWKEFKTDIPAPKFIRPKKLPERVEGKVLVSVFNDGWCQDLNIESDLTQRIVKEYAEKVVYKEYDTSDKDVIREWGIDNAIFVDDEWLFFGPDSVESKLRSLLEDKISRLQIF